MLLGMELGHTNFGNRVEGQRLHAAMDSGILPMAAAIAAQMHNKLDFRWYFNMVADNKVKDSLSPAKRPIIRLQSGRFQPK